MVSRSRMIATRAQCTAELASSGGRSVVGARHSFIRPRPPARHRAAERRHPSPRPAARVRARPR